VTVFGDLDLVTRGNVIEQGEKDGLGLGGGQ
jgi:hypothetical protein